MYMKVAMLRTSTAVTMPIPTKSASLAVQVKTGLGVLCDFSDLPSGSDAAPSETAQGAGCSQLPDLTTLVIYHRTLGYFQQRGHPALCQKSKKVCSKRWLHQRRNQAPDSLENILCLYVRHTARLLPNHSLRRQSRMHRSNTYVLYEELAVTQKPSPVIVGQPVTFTCNGTFYKEEPIIEWYLDPRVLNKTTNKSSSPNIHHPDCVDFLSEISFTPERDHACLTVKCQATSPYTILIENATLEIQAPPTTSEMCVWNSQEHVCHVCENCSKNASVGESLGLECTAKGSIPVSHLAWQVKDTMGGLMVHPNTDYSETYNDASWSWDVISKAKVDISAGERFFVVTCQVLHPDDTIFTEKHLTVFVEGDQPEVICVCCIVLTRIQKRRKNKKKTSDRQTQDEDTHPMITQPVQKQQGGNLRPGVTPDQVSGAFIPEWEFPRQRLKFQEIIGDGNFGQVHKALAKGIVRHGVDTTVAVKTIKGESGSSVWSDFKNELGIFKNLKQHPYVVSILGCCTMTEPFCIIMEYVPNGTLQAYVTQRRLAWTKAKLSNTAPREALGAVHILSFAFQIANGMEYLSSMHLIHRDLATRNVLLGEGLVCKLCDFGLARDVTGSDQYCMLSGSAVPVRWLAVESLLTNTYTTKSDVWSFGILLWELVTLGALPYPDMSPDVIIDSIRNGLRLSRPAHCGTALYKLMASCWKTSSKSRPSFTELQSRLDLFLKFDLDALDMPNFMAEYYTYLP
ncbi:fibroblast growth factor receptor 1-like isoform X3 [Acanthaster planci]|uniref:receptor protein-tyrosine kinase n=1 Tax=Acanthaster planci TaxID=133434 RepID=A0A8B7ZNB0_ACAPL|nr:fibroblast growth factor receptor 1-like isoform X3 [Acanthaster planci]